jgi:hypothetical protein
MVKVVDIESLTKLSGGVVDVEPPQTQNLQRQMSNGGSGMRWWFCGSSMELQKCNDRFGVGNAEVEVVMRV